MKKLLILLSLTLMGCDWDVFDVKCHNPVDSSKFSLSIDGAGAGMLKPGDKIHIDKGYWVPSGGTLFIIDSIRRR